MTLLTVHDLMELYCKATGKFAMAIRFDPTMSYTDTISATPYLEGLPNEMQVLTDGQGVLVFDTWAEMDRYFDLTIGDDGPTEANTYRGPGNVYALTCGPEGLETENT